jgi:hypothetical protein
MWTPIIEIRDIRRYGSTQMGLGRISDRDIHCAPISPIAPLSSSLGGPEWCSYLPDAEVPQSAIEHRTVARVAVVNQKSRRPPIPVAAFHYLLGRPLRCRMRGYCDVQDFPVHVPYYKKERRERDGIRGSGSYRVGVSS